MQDGFLPVLLSPDAVGLDMCPGGEGFLPISAVSDFCSIEGKGHGEVELSYLQPLPSSRPVSDGGLWRKTCKWVQTPLVSVAPRGPIFSC